VVLILIVVVPIGAIPWSGDQHLMNFGGKKVCVRVVAFYKSSPICLGLEVLSQYCPWITTNKVDSTKETKLHPSQPLHSQLHLVS
jgi:hypothetical protein